MADLYESQYGRDHTTLLGAAWRGDVEDLRQKLLKHRPDDIGTEAGERALHLAAMRGHFSAVKLLVESGASIYNVNFGEMSCLHFAAGSGNVATVEYLAAAGVPLDAEDIRGFTPAFSAAAGGHDRLVGWFAANGVDVTAPAEGGTCPVHLAAQCGKASTAQLLIDSFGASPTAPDAIGRPPVHCAAISGNEALALWLYSRWPEAATARDELGETLLHGAAYGRCSALLHKLIADSADVNARSNSLATPLMKAMGRDDARALITAGAEVNAVDKRGNSALHEAYAHRRFGVIRVLLQAGADAGVKNTQDESVITLAQKWGDRRARRFIENELDITLHPPSG